jgi:hypothetical protein
MSTNDGIAAKTVTMQVLNLSFSKNGTLSVATALTILLGGPVVHGRDLTSDPRVDGNFFLPPLRHQYNLPGGRAYSRADWDAGLVDYVGVGDIAATYLWRQLMDAYPEAKVILVQRPVEKWLASWTANIIDSGIFHPVGSAVLWLEKWFGLTGAATFCRIGTVQYFDAETRDQVVAQARSVYAEHYEAVREKCKQDGRELLEYQLGDGWEPLAAFFGTPVPDEPFPHVNEQEEMRKHQRDVMRRELKRGMQIAIYYILPLVAVIVAAMILRR